MKFWLTIGVFAALSLAVTAHAGEPRITIVTPAKSVQRDVVLCEKPAQWALGPENLRGTVDKVVVVKFPYPRFYHFSAGGVSGGVDALALNGEGQVVAVFDGIAGPVEHAHSEEVVSVVFAWSKEKLLAGGVKPGSLVMAEGFSLGATTATPPGQSRRAEVLDRLRQSATRTNQGYDELAAFYFSAGEYADALRAYERAANNGGGPDALAGVGIALAGLGRIDDALATFAKLLEAYPTHLPAYTHLARLLRFIKKPELVVAMLLSGLEKHPELLALRLELAQLYVQVGRPDAARNVLDEAPSPGPDDVAQIARVQGDAHLREGQMDLAAKGYATYLARFPNAPHAAELRLFIARHAKAKQGAKQ